MLSGFVYFLYTITLFSTVPGFMLRVQTPSAQGAAGFLKHVLCELQCNDRAQQL